VKLKTIELAAATAPLAAYATELSEQPLVVTCRGTPIAVLLPVEDTDLETVSLSLDPAFNAMLQRSRVRQAAEGGLSLDEVRREFGLERTPKGNEAAAAEVGTPPKTRRRKL